MKAYFKLIITGMDETFITPQTKIIIFLIKEFLFTVNLNIVFSCEVTHKAQQTCGVQNELTADCYIAQSRCTEPKQQVRSQPAYFGLPLFRSLL